MSTILKNLIQLIKNETLPSANTAIRVGTTLEYLDSEKSDKENTYTKSEVMDLVNEIKLLASSDAKFIGSITPTTPINPDGNIWAFAEAGTYPNSGGLVVNPNTLTILSRAGGVWSKIEVELPSIAAEKVFNPLDNEKASTMKAAAERYDPLLTVLEEFVKPSMDINYVPIAPDVVLPDKLMNIYDASQTLAGYKIWAIDCTKYKKMEITFIRVGGTTNANLIGIKSFNNFNVLIKGLSNNPTGKVETLEFDISQYVRLDICHYASPHFRIIFTPKDGIIIPVDNNAVAKKIKAQITGGASYLGVDVIEMGAKGDGVTDDTAIIQQAVLQTLARGGKILLRDKKYKVSKISIPNVDSWSNVIFEGAFPPAFRFGTAGSFPAINGYNGAEFISDLNDPNSGIINVEQGNWWMGLSNFMLTVRNLAIRSYDNPNCIGINASNAAQLLIEDVSINTSVYNVQSIQPTNLSAGLITPKLDNSAYTVLRRLNISGYRDGIIVNEHTDADAIVLSSCYNALRFVKGHHASLFGRVCAQRNRYSVRIDDKALFKINQLNMEHVGANQSDSSTDWQKTQFELYDPNNLGIGEISYANLKGNLGAAGIVDTFRISGGANVIVKKVGSDVRLTGGGIPSP